jgi:hypothetical protein
MEVFFVGLLVLLVVTAVFYIVFFGFIYYWHLVKTSFVVVPMLFTFEVFFKGFVALVVITLIFKYLPYLVTLL